MIAAALGLLAECAFLVMPLLILSYYQTSGEPTWVERIVHRFHHAKRQSVHPALRELSSLMQR